MNTSSQNVTKFFGTGHLAMLPAGWQNYLDTNSNPELSDWASKLVADPGTKIKERFIATLKGSMQVASVIAPPLPVMPAATQAPGSGLPAFTPPAAADKPVKPPAAPTTSTESIAADKPVKPSTVPATVKEDKPNIWAKIFTPKPKSDTPAPKPASSPESNGTGLWQATRTWAVRGFLGLIALIILATLLEAFVPSIADKTSGVLSIVSSVSIKGDWSGFAHVKDNVTANANVDWVRTLNGILIALTLIALFDTGISNFTGGDMAAVAGFFTVGGAIALIKGNPALAIGLEALGLVLIRRDRDEGKGFQYYILGATAVLMSIHFFGREWESWGTENLAKWFIKAVVGGYFNLTESIGPYIAIGMLVLIYISLMQDVSKDGTMVSLLSSMIAFGIVFGFYPFFNKIVGVMTPGGSTLQNYAAIVIWCLAIPMETREAFSRSIKNGKGIASAILLVVVLLGLCFLLGYVLNDAYGWSMLSGYTLGTIVISLILGTESIKQHQDIGESGWKTWVAGRENILGDIITHPKMPLLFYPTFFSLGYLGLGVLVLIGKLP